MDLSASIQGLLRGGGDEVTKYLEEVKVKLDIDGTKGIAHCYCLQLDGNRRAKVKSFADFITYKIVEYSIPRSQIDAANNHYRVTGSTSETSKLEVKARRLFTHLKNSGEGGEILLYILAQEILKLPQLFCKMSLKTNSEMHFHGVDGIHTDYDSGTGDLFLYWGEPKLHKNISTAISSCFSSIKSYLVTPDGADSPQERDIQLLRDGIDLSNDQLEIAIARFFDKDDAMYNKLKYRGVCLVGFDCDKYPLKDNSEVDIAALKTLIEEEVEGWVKSLSKAIGKHVQLETYDIHIFLLPFPSVQDFRDKFINAVTLA